MLANEDMARVESEAGIIATLIHHPDFSYYSEQLLPNHFTNEENRYIYQAICSLARDGIERIDPYNIIQALTAKEATRRFADELSIDSSIRSWKTAKTSAEIQSRSISFS